MLLFDVIGQSLKRTDHFNPATDSVEYLKAKFTFNDSAWSGKTKTALFRLGSGTYKSVLGTDGSCKVPSEVLVGGESRLARIHGETIFVSLIGEYGKVRITTNEIPIKLNRSGYADAQTPADPTESEYQQMTAVAADAVAEAENARNACETARADLVGVKNLFANAIKGSLSGAVVAADDVSPVEHNPVVNVHGKNLISYPHDHTTKTQNGLTFTDNGDGSVTVVGTATEVTYYDLCKFSSRFFTEGARYFNAMSNAVTFEGYTIKDCSVQQREYGNTFCHLVITEGQTVNKTFYPQVEIGTVATEYTPYLDPSTVTVRRCGKNIFDITADVLTTIGASGNKRYALVFDKPATYTFSCVVDPTITNIAHKIVTDGIYGEYTSHTGNVEFTVTLGENQKLIIYKGQENERMQGGITKAQLEVGEAATAYEPYNGTSYIPAVDGTVSGLTSLSPNMTILTDTKGIVVECEYIRDSNKVIEKLTNAIIALGGTV